MALAQRIPADKVEFLKSPYERFIYNTLHLRLLKQLSYTQPEALCQVTSSQFITESTAMLISMKERATSHEGNLKFISKVDD